jgi:hypothetical protein
VCSRRQIKSCGDDRVGTERGDGRFCGDGRIRPSMRPRCIGLQCSAPMRRFLRHLAPQSMFILRRNPQSIRADWTAKSRAKICRRLTEKSPAQREHWTGQRESPSNLNDVRCTGHCQYLQGAADTQNSVNACNRSDFTLAARTALAHGPKECVHARNPLKTKFAHLHTIGEGSSGTISFPLPSSFFPLAV